MITKRQHVFFSYCGDNEKEAARLRDDLIRSGEDVWLDKKDIGGGEVWTDIIPQAIENCYAFVLCLSKELLARDKSWVYPEIDHAINIYRRCRPGSIYLLLVRFSECEIPRIKINANLALDGLQCIDLFPDDKWNEGLQHLLTQLGRAKRPLSANSLVFSDEAVSPPLANNEREITKPGLIRLLLDRYFPRLHHFLTRIGTLSKPPEMDELNDYLRRLSADIENDVRHKTYTPLAGKEVRSTPSELYDESNDPFIRPITQKIRQIIGLEQGGDAVSAQIAAVNRKSRLVRNILKALQHTPDPLVLLGDPGTGKTMTLQQTVKALADSGSRRVFPIIPLYVRLGEFHLSGKVTPEAVMEYVKRSVPPEIRPYIDALDHAGDRLVIIFDGMDEMSRERYNEHTESLSRFASRRRGKTKTLFSCRITDFSTEFKHQRLVLLPFDRTQITEYLRKSSLSFPLLIEGQQWSLTRLAKRLSQGGLPMEANNPFVLWLLCFQLQKKSEWPKSRVDLLNFYSKENYKQKKAEHAEHQPNPDLTDDIIFPNLETAFAELGRFAYTITERNRGVAIPVSELYDSDDAKQIGNLIRVGKRCVVLKESFESPEHPEHLIRFDHHRLQEYFTAYYIHHTRPSIDWLAKLDAPRWQETMINLILMGGADDVAQTLADSIARPIQRHLAEHKQWQHRRKEKLLQEKEQQKKLQEEKRLKEKEERQKRQEERRQRQLKKESEVESKEDGQPRT